MNGRTPTTIPELVEECGRMFGSKVAYQIKSGAGYRRLTYAELARRAREFAAGLIAMGLRKGDTVAIISENSLQWVIGYCGQAMAGGVGVPLYDGLAQAEMEELVRRSEARFAIISAAVLRRLQGSIPGVETHIVVDEDMESREGEPGGSQHPSGRLVPFAEAASAATDESRRILQETKTSGDDLASILYTSGTTGRAKGVMLTHGNFVSNVESVRRSLPLRQSDRMLLVLPFYHALPFTVGLLTFMAAGIESTIENDLTRLRDRMAEVRPTLFGGVPALFELMYRAILRQLDASGQRERFDGALRLVDAVKRRTGVNIGRLVFRQLHNRLGGRLRLMVSGGAALDPELALNYLRLGLPVIQGWGLTETAPVVSVQRWSPARFWFTRYYEKRAGSVGEALPGVEVGVLDVSQEDGNVDRHGDGELVVCGPNVFPGYFKAPEETREAKVGDWFRTGDLGRIDEDGNIWITGRSKFVIVLESGRKVIPDEVERVLAPDPLIGNVCVLPLEVRKKTVVGAVIHPALEATRDLCRGRMLPLTEHSIRGLLEESLSRLTRQFDPSARVGKIVLSDTPLPQTPLGKVARGRVQVPQSFDVNRWEQSSRSPASAG